MEKGLIKQLPLSVKTILKAFQAASFQIYIVGGSVRGLLVGREVEDWDFTTDAKPEEILKLFPEGFYDNKFGTVGIPESAVSSQQLIEKKSKSRRLKAASSIYEVTTMRKEGVYEDFRRPSSVEWTSKIEEDLARRDFTINAIALSPQGEIIDPFNGQGDLKQKIIRAVGDPTLRFKEDALRLIRATRLATQLMFTIEPSTRQALITHSELINQISWERITLEFLKILILPNIDEGVRLLKKVGLLKHILPELEACFGTVQQGPKHARTYDIGEHSLLTAKFTPSENPIVKLAALLHDIGKVPTYKIDEKGNVTFYGHDVVGGAMVKKITQRFKLSNKDRGKLFILVRYHLFTVEEKQTDSAVRRFIRNVGIENLEDMWALREGDRLGGGTSTPTSWRLEKFKDRVKQLLKKPFTISDLKVDGHDVMRELSISPGRKVGEILKILFLEVLEDASKNNQEYLLERIRQISKSVT